MRLSEARQRALDALVEDVAKYGAMLTMSTVAKLRDHGYIERLPGLEPTFRLTDAGRAALDNQPLEVVTADEMQG